MALHSRWSVHSAGTLLGSKGERGGGGGGSEIAAGRGGVAIDLIFAGDPFRRMGAKAKKKEVGGRGALREEEAFSSPLFSN